MRATGYYDRFSGFAWVLRVICRADSKAESWDVPAFKRLSDTEYPDVSWKESRKELHPRGNDGDGLIIFEEGVFRGVSGGM